MQTNTVYYLYKIMTHDSSHKKPGLPSFSLPSSRNPDFKSGESGGAMENEGDVGINDQVDLDDVEDGEDGESDEMRAALGGVASGLAEQLTTITQEMNKIREELYGDNGIGGIAQELEKLKSGNLGGIGGLLDHPELTGEMDDMDDMDDMDMASAMARPEGGRLRSRPKALSKSAASKVEAPRRPLDKERKLEELRRKIERRHLLEESKQKNEKTGFLEWLVIIFVFFMMIYTASSSFRSQVKLFFGEIFGEIGETEEVFHDFGAVVEEDVDSYF